MTAPTCPISRNQALPGMRPRQLGLPPRALDLPSLIAATNALRDLVLAMYGDGLPLNNMLGAGLGNNLNGGSLKQDPGAMVVVKTDWLEIYRDWEYKRIRGKKKPKSIIDVERINKLVFHWQHNDISMPEDAFEWAYDKSDYATDVWGMAANGVAFGWGQGPY